MGKKKREENIEIHAFLVCVMMGGHMSRPGSYRWSNAIIIPLERKFEMIRSWLTHFRIITFDRQVNTAKEGTALELV